MYLSFASINILNNPYHHYASPQKNSLYFCPVIKNDKYQAVIGLEVHAQLLTKSKLFCSDSTAFGGAPNTQVSPVSLAHPGTLPVMNKQVILHAVKLGIAMHCEIEQHNYFARKNYFYPDLPKGYQVSQHTTPICKGGYLTIQTTDGEKNVKLNRIHMEEDAGKSIHDIDENYTCIDLNRAGMPLLEIVTEPDLHSADEIFYFYSRIQFCFSLQTDRNVCIAAHTSLFHIAIANANPSY